MRPFPSRETKPPLGSDRGRQPGTTRASHTRRSSDLQRSGRVHIGIGMIYRQAPRGARPNAALAILENQAGDVRRQPFLHPVVDPVAARQTVHSEGARHPQGAVPRLQKTAYAIEDAAQQRPGGTHPAKHAMPPAGQQRAIRHLIERKSAAIGVPKVLYKWMGQTAAAIQAAAADRPEPELPVRTLNDEAHIAALPFLSQVQERRQALSIVDLQAESGKLLRQGGGP